MPNTFAYLVLYSYPLIVVLLFRRLPLPKALIWSILGGYLFLPEQTGIDLPMLPNLDKTNIAALSTAFMVWIHTRDDRRQRKAEDSQSRGSRDNTPGRIRRKGGRLVLLLLLGLLLLPFGTLVTNPEPVIWGPVVLPAISLYDAFSMALYNAMMVIPFLLARRHLASPEAHRDILRALVWAGLICSALIFVEVRLSPQLNKWVYGFYSHSFAQHIRGGGFRPMLFLGHGLRVGIFISLTVLAALVLYRSQDGNRPGRWLAAALWLFCILYLSKTLGAFAITFLLFPVVLWSNVRIRLLVAAALAFIVLIYPLARGTGAVPTDRVVRIASEISEARAQSLSYRLRNEDALLDRAEHKPLFGWGIWYRNGLYDEFGNRTSVTDGLWVGVIGVRGWIGYLCLFGLLTLPIIMMFLRSRQLNIDPVTAGMSVVMVANLIDLIPNSGLAPVTWLIGGALAGRYELGRRSSDLTTGTGADIDRPHRRSGPSPRKPALSLASPSSRSRS